MSRMHIRAHPGEVLREWFPQARHVREVATQLQVSRVMLSKILNGKAGITADMALRLATWLNTSPDLWVGMQTQCDLWEATLKPRPSIRPLERLAA